MNAGLLPKTVAESERMCLKSGSSTRYVAASCADLLSFGVTLPLQNRRAVAQLVHCSLALKKLCSIVVPSSLLFAHAPPMASG